MTVAVLQEILKELQQMNIDLHDMRNELIGRKPSSCLLDTNEFHTYLPGLRDITNTPETPASPE